MVPELVIILLILYIAYRGEPRSAVTTIHQDKIKYIRDVIDDVRLTMEKDSYRTQEFSITESTTRSCVKGKKEINLVLSKMGHEYDDNTLVGVALHEYAHILCPDKGHSSLFHKIQSDLLTVASGLGYYKHSEGISSDYPCVMEEN